MPLERLRISSNGQVSIPAHIRRRWGATDVLVIDKGDRVIVRPVPADPLAAVVGKYADLVVLSGSPLDNPPQPHDCSGPNVINDSRWVANGGPGNEPGLRLTPPMTDPDVWYSYRDNNPTAPLGTPCFAYYATTPGPTPRTGPRPARAPLADAA